MLTKQDKITKTSKESALEKSKEWDQYLALTQFRTVITLHFIHDIESHLKNLSLCFQSTDLTPSSLRCSIERTYEQLEAMKTVDGASLCSFWDDLDKTTDSFKGFNLEKRVEGEEMFSSIARSCFRLRWFI